MERILSFDIDLCRIHSVSSHKGVVSSSAAVPPFDAIGEHDTVLIEVASPMFYGKSSMGEINNRFKWAIFNGMTAGRLFQYASVNCPAVKVLASPSNQWTMGHPEKVRHTIANLAGLNHDLRECYCMQFYYRTNPEKWMPFETYFNGLSKAKKKGEVQC
jgi:hypothetical protein